MSDGVRKTILILSALAFIGCAAGKPSRWSHFHGDSSNRGFQPIGSGFALSSSWISNPYRITSSSPVIGTDFQGREVLYVGTTNGKLIAIRSENGTEKWQRQLSETSSNSQIVSSASVSDKGDIYVIANHVSNEGQNLSVLHKVDQFGNLKWSYSFPDNGYTSGSPKVITSTAGVLIFVYVSVGTLEDIQGQLFVLQDKRGGAQLFANKALGTCRFDGASRTRAGDVSNHMDAVREVVGSFPVEFVESDAGLPDSFIDPTVSLFPFENRILVAIADNLCSIGVFEWNWGVLSVLWRHEHDFEKHSSAMVSTNGLMVFGRQDGNVAAYDVLTGVKKWQYEADQSVFATPTDSPENFIFVVSKGHLQVLDSTNGVPAPEADNDGRMPFVGPTYSSPGVSMNRVYVSTREMLMTTTYDLKTRASDTNFHGNGLSSLAIGRDGAVYGVSADGTIRKYAGTE